jgi:O-antigen biosynthesis protein WbqP
LRIEVQRVYRRFVKRLIDIIGSILGLIIGIPLTLLIAAAIKIDSPGPVFFKQRRVGANKNHFYMVKFRTMKSGTPKDTPTHLLKSPKQYITRVGKLLRKSSLDELPQIWHIFMGDMSIIGPRPALWNQFDLIEERDKYGANDVRPGLSGWAQVNGRDELAIEVKAAFDGEYVKRISFLFDCKCFFMTVFKVIRSEGIV